MTQPLAKCRIFRKTSASDTFATLGSSEKLEFNVDRDNKIANGWTTKISKGAPRAIAQHGNPNEDLSEQQDTGQDEKVWTIEGSVSRADLVTNAFLDNLEAWNDGEQESAALPFGRFSIEYDGNPRINVDADANNGLEIRDLTTIDDEETPNETQFILVLSKGKAAS